jgi:hypothetical protein
MKFTGTEKAVIGVVILGMMLYPTIIVLLILK